MFLCLPYDFLARGEFATELNSACFNQVRAARLRNVLIDHLCQVAVSPELADYIEAV
jgi:hypothetical protein